ncbi:MAG: polymerase [Steroidobacteraceae bacterium]|nr:polymerase [Steroidobacteraceae bacterium]
MSEHRAILHVDMDAFFASVEQFDRPELAGQPVVVGGAGGRGVVAAASYESRRFGVHSAMPMREALKRCPHLVIVRPRMKRYREVSDHVFEIFREFTDLVEGLSLDEAFLDVTGSIGLFGSAEDMAREIKSRIRARTGLTASVGVSHNKLLAKLASEMHKPDGLTIIRPGEVTATLDPLPVSRLFGIGVKTAARLEEQGVFTLGQLRRSPDGVLWPLLRRETHKFRDRRRSRSARRRLSTSTSATTRNCRNGSRNLRIARRRACARGSSRPAWSASRCGAATSRPSRGRRVSIRRPRRRAWSRRWRRTCWTPGCKSSRVLPCACSASASAACCRRASSTCSRAWRVLSRSSSTTPWTASTAGSAPKRDAHLHASQSNYRPIPHQEGVRPL